MNSRLRNRIVGAVILASLAVIFVPMILTGQGDLDFSSRGPAIPPEPEITSSSPPQTLPADPSPAEEAPRAVVLEQQPPDVNSGANVPIPPETVEQESALPNPPEVGTTASVASRGVPAWAVQVGSFTVKKSAFALRDSLRSKGYASFVESVKSGGSTVYRVRVGPELQQELAQKLLERLAKEAGVNGIVVRHNQ